MKEQQKRKINSGDWEFPETLFVRDIEDRVFQGIVLQCLKHIDGVHLAGNNFMDNIFGREGKDSLKGIHISQENHSVSIKVEVSIDYGIPIPSKAEEIHTKIAHLITEQTGLHVSCVHIVIRNVIMPQNKPEKLKPPLFIEAKES